MNCKYCDALIHWPENWVKGMKPLEDDTNIEHNKDRCSQIKNKHKTKSGWLRVLCPDCGIETFYNRNVKQDINKRCSECILMDGKL